MRTEIASVQRKTNHYWSVTFELFHGNPGNESMIGRIESAALFESEDAAYTAGHRALDEFEKTGTFPNLNEHF